MCFNYARYNWANLIISACSDQESRKTQYGTITYASPYLPTYLPTATLLCIIYAYVSSFQLIYIYYALPNIRRYINCEAEA